MEIKYENGCECGRKAKESKTERNLKAVLKLVRAMKECLCNEQDMEFAAVASMKRLNLL